jgi:5-methylcytosine-specific restriction endonuclease McrA
MAKGLIEPATQVHHKIRLTSDNLGNPAVSISFDNLEALCDQCHQDEHKRKRWRCDPSTGRVMI